MKQFKLENITEKDEEIVVSIKSVELIKGFCEFEEIRNDVDPNMKKMNIIGGTPPFVDFEESKDLSLMRIQWYGESKTVDFKKEIIDYFDSKTPETFKKTNLLIAETLNFIKEKNDRPRQSVLSEKMWFSEVGKEDEAIWFNPFNYFSANQFQANILDVPMTKEFVIKDFFEKGIIGLVVPRKTTIIISLFNEQKNK